MINTQIKTSQVVFVTMGSNEKNNEMEMIPRLSIDEIKRIHLLRDQGYSTYLIKAMIAVARKKSFDSEQCKESVLTRKQRIIDVAVQVFAQNGYHQTRLNEIAKEVGIGYGTLYLHFPTKQSLFMECVDDLLHSMLIAILDEIKEVKNPLERLRTMMEIILTRYPVFTEILQVLNGITEENATVMDKRKEVYSSVAMLVEREMKEAIEKNLIAPLNSEIISYLMVGLAESATILQNLDNSKNVEEMLDAIISLLSVRGTVYSINNSRNARAN